MLDNAFGNFFVPHDLMLIHGVAPSLVRWKITPVSSRGGKFGTGHRKFALRRMLRFLALRRRSISHLLAQIARQCLAGAPLAKM
jgi:hypothetical protein